MDHPAFQATQSSTPPTPDTVAVPEQPVKPSGRNLKKWIVIFITIGVILFAGIYYFANSQRSPINLSPIGQNKTQNQCPLMDCEYGCSDSKCLSPTPTVDNQKLKSVCEQQEGEWREKYNECESHASDKGLDQKTCTELGGQYTDCASACRHTDQKNAPCPAVCVKVCKF